MNFVEKVKDCIKLISKFWKEDDENRKQFIKLYDKVCYSADKNLYLDAVDWLENAEKAVVVSVSKDGEYSLNTNDDEFDTEFRNQCKFLIQENIFNTIGPEKYQENLEIFEPDLFVSFKEIDYHQSRADYNERLVEYLKASNDPLGLQSPQLSRLWNDICELEKVYKQAEINLNT